MVKTRWSAVLEQGTDENKEFVRSKLCVLPPNTTLSSVRKDASLLSEVDTHTSGMIRCFRVGASIVAEETDLNTKENIWRPMADLEEASAFVADRQEAYEALWGGA